MDIGYFKKEILIVLLAVLLIGMTWLYVGESFAHQRDLFVLSSQATSVINAKDSNFNVLATQLDMCAPFYRAGVVAYQQSLNQVQPAAPGAK